MILTVLLTSADQRMHHRETPKCTKCQAALLCQCSVSCIIYEVYLVFSDLLLHVNAWDSATKICCLFILPSALCPKKKNPICFSTSSNTDRYVNAKQKPYRLSVDCASKKLCASVAKKLEQAWNWSELLRRLKHFFLGCFPQRVTRMTLLINTAASLPPEGHLCISVLAFSPSVCLCCAFCFRSVGHGGSVHAASSGVGLPVDGSV